MPPHAEPVDRRTDDDATTPRTVDKRADRVRAMFAGIARRYDLLNHLLSLNIDRRWRRIAAQEIAPTADERVLDVCCGTGDLAFDLVRRGARAERVLGVDFCEEMLDIARQKGSRRGVPVSFRSGDAMALEADDGSFDVVSVAFGLRNVEETDRGLAELVRVTKPGGRVAILEFSRPTLPPLRWAYLAYFRYLLPRVGQQLAANDHAAYHYLPASVLQFPDGEQLLERMRQAGLAECRLRRLTFGIATLYLGTKSGAAADWERSA